MVLIVAQSVVAADAEIKERVNQFENVARTGLFDNEEYTLEEIDQALTISRGDDKRNPVNTSKRYRESVVGAFHKYAERYDAPSMLFVGMALKESEYKHTALGSRGEKGILQVGKQGRKACADECGVFSSDPDVQICHGYCWFNKIRYDKSCDGTIKQALHGYASGDCTPPASWLKTRKSVRRRYRLWGWLHIKLGREL